MDLTKRLAYANIYMISDSEVINDSPGPGDDLSFEFCGIAISALREWADRVSWELLFRFLRERIDPVLRELPFRLGDSWLFKFYGTHNSSF